MFGLTGAHRDYTWGSATAIPQFLGIPPTSEPLAEVWFGAHASGPAVMDGTGVDLGAFIAADPGAALGSRVRQRFGDDLPFLLKVLAPASPLSMQVHPSLSQAREGYARARRGGPGAPVDYVDDNHKPELLYPLTEFLALCGLRRSGQARDILAGLTHPVVGAARRALAREGPEGLREAFGILVQNLTSRAVEAVTEEVAARRRRGASPDAQADDIALDLARSFPGDPGVVASLLLVPHILEPGEAMFIPPGVVHLYLSGMGVEIMANSDNVLRAGLTSKNVDVPELLRVLDVHRSPQSPRPRLDGPGVTALPAPVEDFELAVVDPDGGEVRVATGGPRILLALEHGVRVRPEHPDPRGPREATLSRGGAVFVSDGEGALRVSGGKALHAGACLAHDRPGAGAATGAGGATGVGEATGTGEAAGPGASPAPPDVTPVGRSRPGRAAPDGTPRPRAR